MWKTEDLTRNRLLSREEWLLARHYGIGASEAAAVVGKSPWTTAADLWLKKTSEPSSKESESNKAISLGVRLEPVLREMFIQVHQEYEVEYHAFDMLSQKEAPWLFATLDGELTAKDGRKGILEIKTSTPNGKAAWAEWDGKVPDHYYIQICHQFLATGYEFAILYAALFKKDGDAEIREYLFRREECNEDIGWLVDKEATFWQSVIKRELPKMTIAITR